MRIVLLLSVLIVSVSNGQVNLQNGSANYEIPIFSFSDAKSGLGTSIALSYSSGNGLVVSDKAGNAGQNWSIVAGGAIIRKQNGEPDDQNSISIFPTISNGNERGFNNQIAFYDDDYQSWPWPGDPYSRYYIDNYFPNGFLYSEFPLDMVEPTQNNFPLGYLAPRELTLLPRFKNNMDKRWMPSRRALTDRQQDIFLYSFNGVSGEFVIGKDGTPLLINDSKIIITKTTNDLTSQGIRTRITQFEIKDETGIIYKFGAYELSDITKLIELSNEGPAAFKKITTSGEPTGKYTIQKWVLTEIVNPATQEKIIFQYDDYSVDVIANKTPTYQFTEGQQVESVQIHEQRVKGVFKRLKAILLPDGHKIDFFYTTNSNRIDVPGDFPVSQIKVSYNESDITTYNLSYGYFVKKEIKNYTDNIPEADKRFARLCLTSIQKSNETLSEPPYKFSYYTGIESNDPKDIVPPFDCMAQDHWGFYNKATNVNIDDPNPSKEVLRDLMLNNGTYRQPSAGSAKFGLLKSVENPLGGKLTFEYEQNDSKDADNPSLTKTAGGVRVFKTTVWDGASNINDILTTYNYKLGDGSTSGWGYESPVYLNRREIKIWNASTLEGYVKEGVLVYDITTARLKQALMKEIKKAIMQELAKSAATVSSFDPRIAYALFVISKLIDGLIVLFNPTDYLWSDSYNYYPFQAQNPIGINYSRVEILNSSLPGGIGKTVNEFTAPANVRAEIPAFVMPYSNKQRFPAWKYGLPNKTFIYNQAGSLIKEVINNYNIVANTSNSINHKSCKVEVIRPESASCTVGAQSNNLPITDFSWEYYYPISGRAELSNTTVKNYSPSGVIAQKDASAGYNSDYFEKTTSTAKSNGDIVTINKYYPNDYNNISTAIQEMKNRNMLAVPISVETWLTKSNGNEYLLDATINEFQVISTGEIKIGKVYQLETKEPLLKSIIGEQNPAVLVRNTTYFKEQQNYNYDNQGLLKESSTPAGRITAALFDYNKRYAIATVTNATQGEIAYSSFEAESKGGWDYNSAKIKDGVFTTGKKCYEFTDDNTTSNISRTISGSKQYTLSFWAINEQPYVNINGAMAGPDKTVLNSTTGWTYYEYTFPGPCTVEISNTAIRSWVKAFLVDEVRLYPKDARMVTTAFDPKVGKITECDVNNRILYYEYDLLGRLKTIKDENRNVVKTYEYNYKTN